MTKFTINPRVVYSGDTCYVTIAAFIVISQSIYLLTHLGARTSICLVVVGLDRVDEDVEGEDDSGVVSDSWCIRSRSKHDINLHRMDVIII